MATQRQETMLLVEHEIDTCGLADFLAHVADICHEKVSHLEANWQDASSAKEWEKAAHLLAGVIGKVNV